MSPSTLPSSCWHAEKREAQQFLPWFEEALEIYILPAGYRSMIRTALGNKFLLLSYFCLTFQHNKQFNQLSPSRKLQIFAYQHYLSPVFLIKPGIYNVTTQDCRVKHPGPVAAQTQTLARSCKLWPGLCLLCFWVAFYQQRHAGSPVFRINLQRDAFCYC